MAKIILEKFCKHTPSDLPQVYKTQDLETFGTSWKLFDYQQNALKSFLNCLFHYFKDKENFYTHYLANGLNDFLDELNVKPENTNYPFLSRYYSQESDGTISFKNFINRASFWMATGSGKTLVMIKMIEMLFNLAKAGAIPEKDIMLLAPKEEILNQIKQHIEIFNGNGNLKIELRDLREYERFKHLQTSLYGNNNITVFYYRADNIRDEDKTELLSYETVLNNGNWYVLLDEAHKGDSEDSKRQQYYTVLSKNGFLFNFSATFIDTIDIVTTAYNFNLKRFIESGYGKHIKVSNEQFRNFNKNRDDEFSKKEKQKIVLKSLITYAAIKKEAEFVKKKNSELYHNPLMLTIANKVHTIDAELKIFFEELAKIAIGDYDLDIAKNELVADLNQNRDYQFGTATIEMPFLQILKDITKKDILKYVFNDAKSNGKIEYTRISGNSREIAFRLKTSNKHFCLLVASDAVEWGTNVLADYEFNNTPLTESYFNEINDTDSEINILLGSRIFSEGWDSNRPNVINFINIGVDEDAQKFVLQATGRGVRIEPIKGERKRLTLIPETDKIYKYISIEQFQEITTKHHHTPIESLFLFCTNKEVISNIIANISKSSANDEWFPVSGIVKNEIKEELLIPKYKKEIRPIPKYKIHQQDYDTLLNYIGSVNNSNDKVLVASQPDIVSRTIIKTINKIRDNNNFDFNQNEDGLEPNETLFLLNEHFNQTPEVLKEYIPVSNEIKHFELVQAKNINPNVELRMMEEKIKSAIESKYETPEQVLKAFQDGAFDKYGKNKTAQFTIEFESVTKSDFDSPTHKLKINRKFFKEHYYKPILLAERGYENVFKHIIKHEGEVTFIENLQRYWKDNSNNKLKNFDWWYFSKIDESVDGVLIPYYNTQEQEYRKFFPDFIFWLKKGNDYHIIFLDPKGVEHLVNPIDKLKGYRELFVNPLSYGTNSVHSHLWFYNRIKPVELRDGLEQYWTYDLDKVFDV